MKTFTQAISRTFLTALLLTAATFISFAAKPKQVLKEVKGFNKVWVAGNVKIILTQSEKEGVFVDEFFNPEKTSVLGKGQTLYINTMESSQVTIRVSLKDVQRIQAAGNAVVVTSNNINVDHLQVFASQNARVKVSAIAGDLYTVVKEDAVLKMSGSTAEHTLVAGDLKNVRVSELIAQKTIRKAPAVDVALERIALLKDTVR